MKYQGILYIEEFWGKTEKASREKKSIAFLINDIQFDRFGGCWKVKEKGDREYIVTRNHEMLIYG